MKACLKFRQLSIALGLSSVLLAGHSYARTPICAAVLLAGQSSEQATKLQLSILELAQLKLNLDLAQSTGQQTAVAKMLAKQYPIRFQQVLRSSEGISEKDLKQKISEQIKILQGRKERDEVQEKQERAASEVLKVSYVLKSERDLPFALNSNNHFFEYLPEQQILVARALLVAKIFGAKHGVTGTLLYDLKTNKPQMIQESSILAEVLPDGKTLISMRQDGKILFFDLESRQEIKSVDTGIMQEKTYVGWGVNSDGSLLAFNSLNQLIVVETQTGKEISRFEGDFFNSPQHAKKIEFLNNEELIIHDEAKGIYKYNIATETRQQLVAGNFRVAIFNPDHSQVLLSHYLTVDSAMKLVNLHDKTTTETTMGSIGFAKALGSTGKYFLKVSKDNQNRYGIYNFASDAPLLDLTPSAPEVANSTMGSEVTTAATTKDGRYLVLQRRDRNDLTRSKIEFYEKN